MTDEDQISAAMDGRDRLLAWSRDTGIARHGDLTQMDRKIAAMCEASYLRKLAVWRRDYGPDRDDRER